MVRICKTLFAAAIVFGILIHHNALAQSTSGDIAGTIVDKSGAAIGQADIKAVNKATAVEFTAVSNANGGVSFRQPSRRKVRPDWVG